MEFEWFDPQPEYDFHGIKTLLQQLFDVDAHLFELSALTDLILSQPLLGSTVKVEGNETDAYAFLSVLNLEAHKVRTMFAYQMWPQLIMSQDKPCVLKLIEYVKRKASFNPSLAQFADLFSQPTFPPIGLILTDRLINVPSEVVPPMYTMLLEEIQWALEEKEPYMFSHYLILSKTYTEVASITDMEEDRPKKKVKAAAGLETFYFHPEDEVLHRHAVCQGGFDYTTKHDNGFSDSKRAFQELGVKPQGHMILIEAAKFQGAVQDMAEFLKPST